MGISSLVAKAHVLALLVQASVATFAALPGEGGGDAPPPTTYHEQGILIRSGETIEPLGPDLMGDAINEFSGDVVFTQTDVSLPGNNALSVAVGRRRALGAATTYGGGLFGDWDLDIPHLRTVASQAEPNWYGGSVATNFNRCSQFAVPPMAKAYVAGAYMTYGSSAFWSSYHLYAPGAGDQTLLKRVPANTVFPSDGTAATYPVVTKNHWQISCLPSLDNGAGEGFLARSPDGTTYRFDHIAVRPWEKAKVAGRNGAASGTGFIYRTQVWILPTLITDRFGNWVRYTYNSADGWRVASIASSDGRTITFTYAGNGNRIASVNDGSRTWTYGYHATTGSLQTVTRPDGSSWQFALDGQIVVPFSFPDPDCDGGENGTVDQTARTGTITHPSGAVGSFTVKSTYHGRSNVPGSQNTCGLTTNPVSRYFVSRSLASKTLSGPGLPAMTWSYDYSVASGSFAPCNGCVNTKTVTVTDPLGHVTVNTYGTQYAINEGLLLDSREGVDGSAQIRSISFSYAPPSDGPYPAAVGSVHHPSDSMSSAHRPRNQRTITQQGVEFTQQVTAFDIFARPTSVTRSSSLGYSRSESTAYHDHTSLWVLGQVASTTIAGLTTSSTTFNPTTALPTSTYKFGKLQANYIFNADGTMHSASDGLNQTTTFSNYTRGLPRTIGFADGTSISAEVNNIGVITKATSEAGTAWNYGYDAMGRLASKTPPGGDAVAYNTTYLSFVQVPTDEVGLGPNHWRQTITTGNAVTTHYFDARWRKRLTTTYDAADRANTERTQRFDFDPYNRTTFAAYPARSIAQITTAVPGTATTYDALGRPTRTVASSELGDLTTTTQYLTGFQKRVTDARGGITTTGYHVFDEPSESAIAWMAAPEDLGVTISRDALGKPLAITRSGTYAGNSVSATRSYVYDTHQQLCKTVEPEIGATIQALDAANNVQWRASGLTLLSTGSCDWGSVPTTTMVSHTYDARNRVTGTGYGDGSPSIGRSYTADGLPLAVVTNGPNASTWTYSYNNRRLLTNESLNFGGQWHYVIHGYDANGNRSQLTYPDNAVVAYTPNALGEPSQASGYASAVRYHPNGAVAGYTLANGIVHTLSQNVRGLPEVNRDAGIVQDQYSYDANGNISAIADQREGVTNRSMAYDGLDRLTVANAPNVWGNASYTYDPLGNLRSSTVGGRVATHNYGANNLLATLNINGVYTGYAYDARGNVTGKGTQGYYFDLGNRMALANGVASYSYDGWGRRTGISANDGSYRVQVYSRAGQLLYGTRQAGMVGESTRYVYLGGKAIAQVSSVNGTTYLHTDLLGSVVATVGTVPAMVTYSCLPGWTVAGAQCTQGTTTTIAATVTGYNCPAGYTLSGSTCALTTTTTSAAAPTYSCPAGWNLSGSTCSLTSSTPASPIYACPAGWTLSGSSCSGTTSSPATSTWDCRGQGSLRALSWSPSGYYCTTRTVNKLAYDACWDNPPAGLPTLGYRPNGTNTVACYYGPVAVYSCPAGATLSGATCTAASTQAASVSGYTCSSGTLSGSNCYTTSTQSATVSYSCGAGQTLSGSTCSTSTTSTTPGTPLFACPSGYTLSGSSCTAQGTATMSATVNYSCASGTVSGSTCVGAVRRTRYEPYGATAAGDVPERLGFTGHVNDADTGLVYMQQRYYDPIAARFLSVDPIVTDANTGQHFNIYEYAANNPYRYTDPDGRTACSAFMSGCTVVQIAGNAAAKPPSPSTLHSDSTPTVVAGGFPAKTRGDDIGAGGRQGSGADGGTLGSSSPKRDQSGAAGCIYCVKGDKTSSGKDYVGSTNNMSNRQRDKSDGRDRGGAEVIGTYPKGDRGARRASEQQAINDRGGVGQLDNKRNEVAPEKWPSMGITPP